MVKNILRAAGISLVAFSFGLGVQVISAQTYSYQDPVCGPNSGSWPNCNVAPPLNTGPTDQTKTGNIETTADVIADGIGGRFLSISRNVALANNFGQVVIGPERGSAAFPSGLLRVQGNAVFLNSVGSSQVKGIQILGDTISAKSFSSSYDNPVQTGDADLYIGDRFSGTENIQLKANSQQGSVIVGNGGLVNLDVNGNLNVVTRPGVGYTYVRGTVRNTANTINANESPSINDWPTAMRNNRMSSYNPDFCDDSIRSADCLFSRYPSPSINASSPDVRYDLFINADPPFQPVGSEPIDCGTPPNGDSQCTFTAAGIEYVKTAGPGDPEGGIVSAYGGRFDHDVYVAQDNTSHLVVGDGPKVGKLTINTDPTESFGLTIVTDGSNDGSGRPTAASIFATGNNDRNIAINAEASGASNGNFSFYSLDGDLYLADRANIGGSLNNALSNNSYDLQVVGDSNVTGDLCIDGNCISAWDDVTGNIDLSNFVSGSGSTGSIPRWGSGQSLTNSIINQVGSNRIGVNKSNPRGTLEVGGSLVVGVVNNASVVESLVPQNGVLVGGRVQASGFCIGSSNNCVTNWNSIGTWEASGANIYRVAGNVGVGTTSPSAKLHVQGTFNISSGGGTSPALEFRPNAGDLYVGSNTQDGNIFVRNRAQDSVIALNGQNGSISAQNIAAVNNIGAFGNVTAWGDLAGTRVRAGWYCDVGGSNCVRPGSFGGASFLAQTGYQEIGNIIIQWGRLGRGGSEGTYNVSFPRAFGDNPYSITCTAEVDSGTEDVFCNVESADTRAMTLRANWSGSTNSFDDLHWMAIGRRP